MKNIFRINEWFFFKFVFFVMLFFLLQLAKATVVVDLFFIKNLIFVCLYLIEGASLGYYINDLFDIKQDKLAGKNNFASYFNAPTSYIILFALKVSLVTTWYLFNKNEVVLFLVLFQILLFYLYSIPYTRFKEKQIGVFFDSLYAYVIPGLVIYFVVLKFNIEIPFLTVYLLWLFFLGLRGIIQHQIKDYYFDKRTSTKTFAQIYGIKKTLILEKIWLPVAEIIFFMTFLYTLSARLLFLYLLYIAYILLRLNPIIEIKQASYTWPKLSIVNHLLNQFYNKWLPIIIFFLLLCIDYRFIPFFFLYIIIALPSIKSYMADVTYLYYKLLVPLYYQLLVPLYYKLLVPLYYIIKGIASFFVNYSIYYVFLLFGKKLTPTENEKNFKNEDVSLTNKKNTKELKAEITISQNITVQIKEKNVHGMWIGTQLSNIELLTINSFLKNGYEFHLWAYDKIETPLPKEIIIENANEIIPDDKIFIYKNQTQFNTGKGSVAGFSDIFRYKLLYEKGGWWVDMDVTCLKPFDVETDYFFRAHHNLKLVGNVMKAPKGSLLMKQCYEQAALAIDENNQDWHKPIHILIQNVEKFGLENCIYNNISNTDEFYKLESFYFGNDVIPANWCFIHWCNEVLRTYMIDKNKYYYSSKYGALLRDYNVCKSKEQKFISLNEQAYKKELLVCNLIQIL